MPVDDDIIIQKMKALNDKNIILRKKMREIDRIRGNLANIQDLPDPSDNTKKLRRIDTRTGAKFTDVERQKIYDKALTDAAAVLA